MIPAPLNLAEEGVGLKRPGELNVFLQLLQEPFVLQEVPDPLKGKFGSLSFAPLFDATSGVTPSAAQLKEFFQLFLELEELQACTTGFFTAAGVGDCATRSLLPSLVTTSDLRCSAWSSDVP